MQSIELYVLEITNMEDKENLEKVYHEIYDKLSKGQYSGDKERDVELLLDILFTHDLSFVRAYSLLILAAIFDNLDLSEKVCLRVSDKLIEYLKSLNDFSVFDEKKRFVHLFSHSLFLGESLLAKLNNNDALIVEMINTYLSADIIFSFNEDLFLANVICEYSTEDIIKKELCKLEPIVFSGEGCHEIFSVGELNKRLLWSNLFMIGKGEITQMSLEYKRKYFSYYLD